MNDDMRVINNAPRWIQDLNQLSVEEVYKRLDAGEIVYLLHFCGIDDIGEYALKFETIDSNVKVWVKSPNGQPYQVDMHVSKIAHDTISFNRYQLSKEQFDNF